MTNKNDSAALAPTLPVIEKNIISEHEISSDPTGIVTKSASSPPVATIKPVTKPPIKLPPTTGETLPTPQTNVPVLPQNTNTNSNTNSQTITNQAPVYSAPTYQAPVYNFDYPEVQSSTESEKAIPGSSNNIETIAPVETVKKSALGLDNYQLGSLIIGVIGVAYLIVSSRPKSKKSK